MQTSPRGALCRGKAPADTNVAMTLRKLFLRRFVPYVLFALACGLSIGASWYLSTTASETAAAQARAEFQTDAEQTLRHLQAGLNTYAEVVRAGAVLLAADTEINGSEFRRFVRGLQLRERYPGMEGIGFAQCIRRQDLGRLLRSFDLDGNTIKVWPPDARAVHCPTVFLEPTDARNRQAIGFDLMSHPLLEKTMAEARDSGQPAATPKLVDLPVWNTGWRGTVLMFIPIYRAMSVASVEARRNALVGFVFSPLDSERVVHNITASGAPRVAFDVYDESGAASEEHLLGRWNASAGGGVYRWSSPVQVSGRTWIAEFQSTGEPESFMPVIAQQTLVGGLLLSLMLLWITRTQVRALETAARHEAELRASAEALRQSEAEAQAANRAKDEFLATISHELRTPLNVVLGWVSMLRSGRVREERLSHALEIIERNAKQQAELIDDLLDVSRIVRGSLRVERQPVRVAPIVSSVVEAMKPAADAKGLQLTLHSTADDVMIRADTDRFQQITRNLVSNAIKFTPPGGRIWVELTHLDRRLRLTVRDTGIGIAPEFLPFVFERFRQADSSTTRTESGVGLGLAIVRHLVQLHGGSVLAKSDGLGRGATFIAEFPAVSAPGKVTATLPIAPSVGSSAPRLDQVRVLVVDDDANTRELLTEALGTTGARVITADSARTALEKLSRDGVDVIAMPGEDGLWLMSRVRALPGDIGQTPAIALTALARTEDRMRAIEAGYQLHFAKPVQLGELQAGVATLLGQRVARGAEA
jgi:signal transduction histidine kinase/ActR/RegA family two-component response regulator